MVVGLHPVDARRVRLIICEIGRFVNRTIGEGYTPSEGGVCARIRDKREVSACEGHIEPQPRREPKTMVRW